MTATIVTTIVATLAVAATSIALAAWLSLGLLGRFVHRMVSFSIGVLLATTFLHLLPEAFDSGAPQRELCAAILVGLLVFFFLEKIAVYRHSHHFEGDGHHHAHGHDADEAGRGGVFVLVGSAVHNFSDGIVIAGAFIASPWVGVAATLSILAHEVPHKIGDFIVLINARVPKRRAIVYASMSSSAIVVGGLVGLAFLERMNRFVPYVLAIAAANFLYIALSDLVPQMQRVRVDDRRARDTVLQAFLIGLGVLVVVLLNGWLEPHGGRSARIAGLIGPTTYTTLERRGPSSGARVLEAGGEATWRSTKAGSTRSCRRSSGTSARRSMRSRWSSATGSVSTRRSPRAR